MVTILGLLLKFMYLMGKMLSGILAIPVNIVVLWVDQVQVHPKVLLLLDELHMLKFAGTRMHEFIMLM